MSAIIEVKYGFAEMPKKPGRISEDFILIEDELDLFGVFDGMGGQGGNPRAAAEAGANAVKEFFVRNNEYEFEKTEDAEHVMSEVIMCVRRAVNKYGNYGSAVGSVAKLAIVNSEPVVLVAHAGDTRMFSLGNGGEILPITDDQSIGNSVLNGYIYGWTESDPLDQSLVVGLNGVRRLMICSDGITGDWPEQKLTEDEFYEAFSKITPQESADEFMKISKKEDDKSVLVIDFVK